MLTLILIDMKLIIYVKEKFLSQDLRRVYSTTRINMTGRLPEDVYESIINWFHIFLALLWVEI